MTYSRFKVGIVVAAALLVVAAGWTQGRTGELNPDLFPPTTVKP